MCIRDRSNAVSNSGTPVLSTAQPFEMCIRDSLRGVLAAVPAIPYVMRSRRQPSVAAYVIGGLGFAVLGGLAALMFFSPRTRNRALNAAKDTYGKVNEKIGTLRSHDDQQQASSTEEEIPVSNGLAGRRDYSTSSGM